MIRATLQGCIDLFNSNIIMQRTAIRGMEQLGEWETAARYWRKLGDDAQEKTCLLIKSSNDLGNAYRAETKELIDWVDQTVEAGVMTENEAIKIIYPKLNEAYNKIYKS